MALFWSFPGSILVGVGVAAGLAAINSVGNLGSTTAGIAILGGCMVVAGGLIAMACKDYGLLTSQSSQHGR